MRLAVILAGAIGFAVVFLAAASDPPPPAHTVAPTTAAHRITFFIKHATEYPSVEGGVWQVELGELLQKNRDVDAAAQVLAPRYGLSVDAMKETIQLWIAYACVRHYCDPDTTDKERTERGLQSRLAVLLRKTNRAALVARLFTASRPDSQKCDPKAYAEATNGVRDLRRVGWAAIAPESCSNWWRTYASQVPREPALLIKISSANGLSVAERLSLQKYVLANFPFERLSAADAHTLRVRQSRAYLAGLWEAGFVVDGLDFFESHSAEMRSAILREGGDATVMVDGLEVFVEEHGDRESDFSLTLAAEYYFSGRNDDASRLIASLNYADAARATLECASLTLDDRRTHPNQCRYLRNEGDVTRWMMLDYALHKPRTDPYPFLEHAFAGSSIGAPFLHGAWAAAFNLFAARAEYSTLADRNAEIWATYANYMPGHYRRNIADIFAALDSTTGGQWKLDEPRFREKYEDAVRVIGGPNVTPYKEVNEVRNREGPAPSPFREAKLPPNLPAARPPSDTAWLKTVLPLPDGYNPVRIEREGDTAVAISVSQNLDPTGEISPGGYWVHVSHDRGKTWDGPLYTGLAAAFPYIVVAESRLPLIAGDRLNIEVENRELDLSSITYPPVALRSKGHIKGLYLEIPLAALRRDGDGDGITDIMETHLLLDPKNADSDGDGVHDGRDTMPNVARAARGRPADAVIGGPRADFWEQVRRHRAARGPDSR